MSADKSQSVEEILLQFIAEYHQGLNELAGHGTAIDQALTAIEKLMVEAKKDEIERLKFIIDNSILTTGDKFDYSFFETAIKLRLVELNNTIKGAGK